jgi:hypothetical protein
MSKLIRIAGLGLSALALTAAAASAGSQPDASRVNKLMLAKTVGCSVAGTPTEFPDDIWIMNKGLVAIAAGTSVHWSVPAAGKAGNYVLPASLAPGKGVKVDGVLAGGVEAGKPCKASI